MTMMIRIVTMLIERCAPLEIVDWRTESSRQTRRGSMRSSALRRPHADMAAG
jgi:hypothetical protein